MDRRNGKRSEPQRNTKRMRMEEEQDLQKRKGINPTSTGHNLSY
jgi:hypothetical protein